MITLCNDPNTDAQTPTLATSTLQRNAQMTSPKSNSTMFLKSRAGRANLDTKFPKPFDWLSVMMSALWVEMEKKSHKCPEFLHTADPSDEDKLIKCVLFLHKPTCQLCSRTI